MNRAPKRLVLTDKESAVSLSVAIADENVAAIPAKAGARERKQRGGQE